MPPGLELFPFDGTIMKYDSFEDIPKGVILKGNILKAINSERYLISPMRGLYNQVASRLPIK